MKTVKSAFGCLVTTTGIVFDLDGEIFYRGSSTKEFPMAELLGQLQGMRIASIDPDNLGEGACVVVESPGPEACFESAEEFNRAYLNN